MEAVQLVEASQSEVAVTFVGKEDQRRFARAMARVASASAACRWSRGRRTEETLAAALTAAERAADAISQRVPISSEAKAQALERSGLDGSVAAHRAQALCEAKLQPLAARLVALADGLDEELAGIPAAALRFETEPLKALEDLDALSEDRARTVRARLHALWWRRHLAQTTSDDASLVTLLGEAMELGDWRGAEQVLHALRASAEELRRASHEERNEHPPRAELVWPFQPMQLESSEPGWQDTRQWS